MTKHTPGPWGARLRDDGESACWWSITNDDGCSVACVYEKDDASPVAAVPDLLSVLQVIFNRVMYESPTAEIETIFDADRIERVRGVLDKARGKS